MATVLLVDDEPGLLFALELLIESRGDTPVVASRGEEAFPRLDGVDAVVTDFAMPGIRRRRRRRLGISRTVLIDRMKKYSLSNRRCA